MLFLVLAHTQFYLILKLCNSLKDMIIALMSVCQQGQPPPPEAQVRTVQHVSGSGQLCCALPQAGRSPGVLASCLSPAVSFLYLSFFLFFFLLWFSFPTFYLSSFTMSLLCIILILILISPCPFFGGEFKVWISVPTSCVGDNLLQLCARCLYEPAIMNSLSQ